MRIAIVGAGVAGLSAGTFLKRAGLKPVLFEQSGQVGGRVATRKIDGFTFDYGATSISPRNYAIGDVLLKDLSTENLVRVVNPIWVMQSGRTFPGEASRMVIERYAYQGGIATFADLLSEGLDVRLNSRVDSFVEEGDLITINDEPFDAVIVAIPVPKLNGLIQNHPGKLAALASVTYRSCLSAMLAYPLPPMDVKYHALVEPEQTSPVIWISHESIKVPSHAPPGQSCFVVQFGPQFSKYHFEDSDHEIAREAISALARLYGPEYAEPIVYQIKRWRFAQPEATASFERVNPLGSRLVIAGDGLLGARVELAFETGMRAAERVIQLCQS